MNVTCSNPIAERLQHDGHTIIILYNPKLSQYSAIRCLALIWNECDASGHFGMQLIAIFLCRCPLPSKPHSFMQLLSRLGAALQLLTETDTVEVRVEQAHRQSFRPLHSFFCLPLLAAPTSELSHVYNYSI